MKKIILACLMLAFIAPAASARKHRRTSNTANAAATATPPGTSTSTTVTVQGSAKSAVGSMQQSTTVKAADPTNPNTNGGMAPVPDHAYTPAGTEAVGAYGNGTGGSTLGSTNDNGGTGVTNTKATNTGTTR